MQESFLMLRHTHHILRRLAQDSLKRISRAKKNAGLCGSMGFACVMWGGGDLACQSLENRLSLKHAKLQTSVSDQKCFECDYARAFRQSLYGTVIMAPVAHVWYESKINGGLLVVKAICSTRTWGSNTIAFAQTFMTQIFIAPVLTFVYLFAQEIFQGNALKDAVVEVQSKGFQMLLADWCFWPLADFLNFRFSSVHIRFVVMNLQDVVWSGITSWIKNTPLDEQNLLQANNSYCKIPLQSES